MEQYIAFAWQQTGALELLLPSSLDSSIRSRLERCPPGSPGGADSPCSTAAPSRNHTRVSGWLVSSSPRKRVLNRCTTHTTHPNTRSKPFSFRRERRERRRRREERRHQRCERERGERERGREKREGERERRERASVLRRWPQPPVIVASSTSIFLSRSCRSLDEDSLHTRPRRATTTQPAPRCMRQAHKQVCGC